MSRCSLQTAGLKSGHEVIRARSGSKVRVNQKLKQGRKFLETDVEAGFLKDTSSPGEASQL